MNLAISCPLPPPGPGPSEDTNSPSLSLLQRFLLLPSHGGCPLRNSSPSQGIFFGHLLCFVFSIAERGLSSPSRCLKGFLAPPLRPAVPFHLSSFECGRPFHLCESYPFRKLFSHCRWKTARAAGTLSFLSSFVLETYSLFFSWNQFLNSVFPSL